MPEEALMEDHNHACRVARGFVHALVAHGTTTASVFGAHFAPATAALFEAAELAGLRIAAGLVLSDRRLLPQLTSNTGARLSREQRLLIERFHRHGRLTYAITPRFALSTSEAMLEVCQTLLSEHEGLLLQTHINENVDEIAEVERLFPWAADYLAVYERFGLSRRTQCWRTMCTPPIRNWIAWPRAAPPWRIARAATRLSVVDYSR